MSLLEKFYTFIILGAVVIGLALGQLVPVGANAEMVVLPLLMAMLYLTFLQIPFEKIKAAFFQRRFTYTAVALNFIWVPLLAWGLAMVFLKDHPALYIGFLMLMVTPCTDWYLVFTGMAKGNVAASTALLPINLIFQLILLPVYLFLFAGTTGYIETSFLFQSILLVLVIPLVFALVTNFFFKRRPERKEHLLEKMAALPIVFLGLAIAAMFASQGQLLFDNIAVLGVILVPLLAFFLINFSVGWLVGRRLGFSYEDQASLSLTTLARNSPVALAIAMTAFPDQPLIPLALVIGPLLELPILAVMTQLLLVLRKRQKSRA